MIPTSRYIGGATRPRDLRSISRSRVGHLDQLLFPAADTPAVLGCAAGPPSTPDLARVLLGSMSGRSSKGTVEGTTSLHRVDASLLARSAPRSLLVSQRTRSFHSSSRALYDSTSYNVTDVPDFFIKYKQYRAIPSDSEVRERQHDDLGLMQSVTDSILSGDVVATTRRLEAKIPVEHHIAEGCVVHPSGFVVPGPGHTSTSDFARAKERERNENEDRLVQTAAVAHRVLESDFEQIDATTFPLSHKVPFEVREPDGSVKHPSGFVPPTPAHKFRYTVSSGVLRERMVSAARQMIRQSSPPRAVLRAVHTSRTSKVPGDA